MSAVALSRLPRPVRSSLAATRTVKDDGPRGVQVKEPSPRRKVASRSNTTRPSGRVTVTWTADSFETLNFRATGSSSAPSSGPR